MFNFFPLSRMQGNVGIKKLLIINSFCYIFLFLITLSFFSSCASSRVGRKSNVKTAKKAVAEAKKYTGVKYKWGGTSKRGLDCSGLMYLAWKGVGKKIPRTSKTQGSFGKPVKKAKVRMGDMVFFRKRKYGRKISHVGMITNVSSKRIKFIHASSSRGVVEDNLLSKYWSKRYLSARRVVH